MDSFKVLDNGQVMRVYHIRDNVIEAHYDMFYHVKLTVDKSVILSNDVDTATVTARVYDYLDNPINYTGDIHYKIEDESFTLPAIDGLASVEVTSVYATKIEISAWIDNARAGVITIDAKTS